mmetsp:Transcript_4807/g.10171  ORF Transcript_4807/g.10171 Transcript_4807/m.10171 type:complete len:222 (-) Transcript_4807:993-1658(-)
MFRSWIQLYHRFAPLSYNFQFGTLNRPNRNGTNRSSAWTACWPCTSPRTNAVSTANNSLSRFHRTVPSSSPEIPHTPNVYPSHSVTIAALTDSSFAFFDNGSCSFLAMKIMRFLDSRLRLKILSLITMGSPRCTVGPMVLMSIRNASTGSTAIGLVVQCASPATTTLHSSRPSSSLLSSTFVSRSSSPVFAFASITPVTDIGETNWRLFRSSPALMKMTEE